MLGETENQFALTRAALSTGGRAKSNFLSVLLFLALHLGLTAALAQPVITGQPQNQTNFVGTTALFTVGATGTEPLSYQWRSYLSATSSSYTNIPFGTEATLVLANVQPTSRSFGVVVTDPGGLSATSSLARLTVVIPPYITRQPLSHLVPVGASVAMRVELLSTALMSYQWRFNGTNLPGATGAQLSLTKVQLTNAGNYSVVVTNVLGGIESGVAALTVVPPLSLYDVPVAIRRDRVAPEVRVNVSWPTDPGKTYDVFTAEALERAWITYTVGSHVATSSVSGFIIPADQAMRFYRVREQAAPPGNTLAITDTTIVEAEKILGLTFTPDQRGGMLAQINDASGTVGGSRALNEAMRTNRLRISDPPSLLFNPVPRGFLIEKVQRPISWSAPHNLAVPTHLADLAFYSVRDLGELIRTRQLTSTDLTRICLSRLKRLDLQLTSVVTITEELALRQAAQADAELAAGTYRGPLHGIPYGIKDAFSAKNYPTTWGSAPYRNQVIDEDATVVSRLEAAGAVLVAKLSMGARYLGADGSGDQWFGGRTRNPWNLNEGSEGSSAGPAAATAAGLVPFAIGTETVISIVSPCTRCRVTGLRSTFGRISRTGVLPLSWSMDKVGPICRSVEDCAIVFEAIRGSDSKDEAVIDSAFNYQPNPDLSRLRVGYRPGVSTTVLERLSRLVGQTPLVSIALPDLPIASILFGILNAESAAVFDEATRFGADALFDDDWAPTLNAARLMPAVEYLQADRLRHILVQEMAALMKTVDVFVTHEQDIDTLYVGNLTGQPCVVIPHGGNTSLSFVGRVHDEATVLALAKAYQDDTSFHTNRPPLFVE